MRVWLWHVHGSWTTSYVQGTHTYLLPVLPDRGPDGRGRARTWTWPRQAREIAPEAARDAAVDVVVLQRPHELGLFEAWTGRRPGRDVPAVYVEHNTPGGSAANTRHALADRDDIPVVHVTHFNELMWDSGRAPTTVIEHGVVDPGHRYVGDRASAAVVVNEPERRGRAVGADLLARLAGEVPLELFGLGTEAWARSRPGVIAHGEIDQLPLHTALSRRRVYVHPYRWTSLGLALIEAMMLGLPIVAVGGTAVPEAVPPDAGVVATEPRRLAAGVKAFLADHDLAVAVGHNARRAARKRFALERFLDDWDHLLQEVVR
jgi:hypothetical protein